MSLSPPALLPEAASLLPLPVVAMADGALILVHRGATGQVVTALGLWHVGVTTPR